MVVLVAEAEIVHANTTTSACPVTPYMTSEHDPGTRMRSVLVHTCCSMRQVRRSSCLIQRDAIYLQMFTQLTGNNQLCV